MTDLIEMNSSRFQLGLIHAPAPLAPNLDEFALWRTSDATLAGPPKPPANVPLIAAHRAMDLNDQYGDCTIAGCDHVNQQGALILGEKWTPTNPTLIKDTYFSLTGGSDSGLLLSQVLQPWHTTEFLGQPPNGGYAYVHPKNTTQVKQSIWIFGNAYMAVNLPAIAQDQFKPDGSGVWELTHTSADYDIEGGHCIVGVAYSPEGVYMVTWDSTVLATWEWWFMYGVQAYAVVPPAFKAHNGDGRGFDLHAIDMWLPKV